MQLLRIKDIHSTIKGQKNVFLSLKIHFFAFILNILQPLNNETNIYFLLKRNL